MKLVLFVLGPLLFFSSNGCGRETCSDAVPTTRITVTLSAEETYVHDFGNFGIEDRGPSIQVQATHFERSEIIHRSPTTTYYYKPRANYSGKDFVEFKIESGSMRTAENPNVRLERITFNVQ